jgi:hypothetical protein
VEQDGDALTTSTNTATTGSTFTAISTVREQSRPPDRHL